MALSPRQRVVLEGTSAIYSSTIVDENGAVIAASSLTTLTLTLYDKETGDIINGREDQNVLNANNVTVSALGVLTWTMQPGDNEILSLDNLVEIPPTFADCEHHVALFEWTWNTPVRSGKHEVDIYVKNLDKVT